MGFINEEATLAILRYVEEYLFEPKEKWSQYWFDRRSYSRWAAFELLNRTMDSPMKDPAIVIDEFILEMVCYECLAEGTNNGFIFSTAYETAEDILALLERRKDDASKNR